ncbi:MAG: MBL fold metallo-hydrolase [bacterium]|nr:MBL fold metallo-hydrolase [bacterium]
MIIETIPVGPLEVNCYIVAAGPGQDAVVIDPGDEAEKILERLGSYQLKLKTILNTHGHFDHIGANSPLKQATGAEIVVHEKDGPLLEAADRQAAMFGLTATPSPPPDRTVAHDDTIDVGGLSFRVIGTPGHTEGGVSFFVDQALFCGDTLFAASIGRTDLPGGSFRDLIQSIQQRILPLGDHIVLYPGHGPASTVSKEKRSNPFIMETGTTYL